MSSCAKTRQTSRKYIQYINDFPCFCYFTINDHILYLKVGTNSKYYYLLLVFSIIY